MSLVWTFVIIARTSLEIEPYSSGRLPLGGSHVMYWNNPAIRGARRCCSSTGGPGAGAAARIAASSTGDYRIVIFDQRGCGRSTPHATVADNTTPHLVADIEALLRSHLNIRRWLLLFGGSWGSTLALAYGIRWPERCSGFVLRGIFLGTRREIDWFLYGMGALFE